MLGKAKLDLERIHPLTGDLDQVVGAAAEEMKAVAVAHEAVAGVNPAPVADGLLRFVRPVPVQWRRGIAAYPEDAFFVVVDFATVSTPERNLIAGDAKAGGAESFPVRQIG